MFISFDDVDPWENNIRGTENHIKKMRRVLEKIEKETKKMNEREPGRVQYAPYNKSNSEARYSKAPIPETIIFNGPATIIKWTDGSKTVVKTQNDEPFDPEKGIAMAFMKKIFGNKGNYNTKLKKFIKYAITQNLKEEK